MNASIKDGNLVITIPLQSPSPSSSGKTLIIASTGGFAKTNAALDGKQVSVSVNATVKP